MQFTGLLDMLDGGGAGRAGDKFEGGPLSGLLNMIGIKPMGYFDRQATMSSSGGGIPRPAPMGGTPGAAVPPVSTQPMIGNLTPQDIMAAIERGTPPAPYRQPPMPQPARMPTLQEMMELERFRRELGAAQAFENSGIFGRM